MGNGVRGKRCQRGNGVRNPFYSSLIRRKRVPDTVSLTDTVSLEPFLYAEPRTPEKGS